MDRSDLIANVKHGHGRGWSFTPLAMTPPSAGKRPIRKAWAAAGREALAEALAWAAAGNVGLRTGAVSGLLVVDLDTGKDDYAADVVKALALPLTITAITGSGGYHLYYALPDGVQVGNSSGKLAPAVDTRGDGGQVVYPGSLHVATGNVYRWMADREPWAVDLAELPPAVLAVLTGQAEAPAHGRPGPAAPGRPPAGTAGPGRNPGGPDVHRDRRLAAYGRRALLDTMARVSAAREGTRNHTLNEAAYTLGQLVAGGVLDRLTVEQSLTAAAMAAGLGKAEASATIRSGLGAGAAEPRHGPADIDADQGRRPPAAATPSSGGKPSDPGTPGGPGRGDRGGDGFVRLGQVDPDTGRLVLSTRRTLPTAKAYVDRYHDHADGRTLHSYAGRLLAWRGNRYLELEDGAARNRLQPWLHAAGRHVAAGGGKTKIGPFPSNPATVTAALETVRAFVHVDQGRDVPCWIAGGADKPDPRDVLPCLSCNLHIPTGTRTPATPDLFTFNALDFDYDPDAAKPAEWFAFLAELWPDDRQAVGLLQEWFGYCLTADTVQQKMLLLVGPRRSGKGTIGRVLTNLVGRANVGGPTTSSLAGGFGLQPLLGKSLALVSDARFSGPDMPTVVERLLCISGEDPITIDRKYAESITCRLPIRFMFLTNELPRLKDAAGALVGRFLVLTLTQSFFGKEDPALAGRLLAELAGILLWALEGWRRLHARGRFETPESSRESEIMLHDLASPVSAFLRDCCEFAPDLRVTVAELYAAYRAWSQAEGNRYTANCQGFGRELAAAIPGIRPRRNHTEGRFYEGLAVKAGYPPPADPLEGWA